MPLQNIQDGEPHMGHQMRGRAARLMPLQLEMFRHHQRHSDHRLGRVALQMLLQSSGPHHQYHQDCFHRLGKEAHLMPPNAEGEILEHLCRSTSSVC